MKRCNSGTSITRAKCGEKRCFYSMRIHEALRRTGLNVRAVGSGLGISGQAVSATISGKNHSEKVLNALREIGVPEKYLFDPRRVSNMDVAV